MFVHWGGSLQRYSQTLIAKQLLLALNHLHSVSLTHLNLTAEDISLVDHKSQPFKVKLSGFGFAGKTSKLSKMEIPKTIGHCAPEVLLDCPLNESVDIWSLGSLLASLFVGRPLFPTECAYEYLKIIMKLFGQPDQTKTEDKIEFKDLFAFVDLLKKMLTLNPEDRISPADALNHRFISMEHFPVSNASETHEIPAVSQITSQDDVKIHESDLDVADSCKKLDPSMLELEKGAQFCSFGVEGI
uniref:Protein kinase domain-containing protein n=1 Tax=Nothobranchius furzeri TaxID=105023 RepID=A0A8C6LV97_NOTFU